LHVSGHAAFTGQYVPALHHAQQHCASHQVPPSVHQQPQLPLTLLQQPVCPALPPQLAVLVGYACTVPTAKQPWARDGQEASLVHQPPDTHDRRHSARHSDNDAAQARQEAPTILVGGGKFSVATLWNKGELGGGCSCQRASSAWSEHAAGGGRGAVHLEHPLPLASLNLTLASLAVLQLPAVHPEERGACTSTRPTRAAAR
jgi:hypothetical protein